MKTTIAILFSLFLLSITGSVIAADNEALLAKIADLQAQVDAYKAERTITAKNLKTFDDLDLIAFNNRDMAHIKRIHAHRA